MLALLLACTHDVPSSPSKPGSDGETTTPVPHTTPPTATTPSTSPAPALDDLSWSLNADVGSVVVAAWTQSTPGPVHVEYSFDPDVWESSPEFDAEAGPQTQVLVGIPFGATAQWRVVSGDASADGPDIVTAPVPTGFPLPRVAISDSSRYLPTGRYLLGSLNARRGAWVGGSYWTFILDRQGRPVWLHLAPNRHWTLFAQPSVTGDTILWDESTAWSDFDRGRGSQVHETWLDEEVQVRPTPGLHHAFVELPDETLAYGSILHDATEALVEKAPAQPDETVIWTCADDWPRSGDCESNGLYYDAPTDTYLYSFYTNSSVVEVARSGDEVGPTPGYSVWWAGAMPGGYAFVPRGYEYSWQHGISWTPDRTLLVSSTNKGVTWLLEYQVDDAAKTLTNVWHSSSHAYAEDNGAAWRLSNGNTLHVVGTAGVVREVTPDDVDVWRLTWDGPHNMGEGELLDDLYAFVKPRPTTR